jgi:hypothetical protein
MAVFENPFSISSIGYYIYSEPKRVESNPISNLTLIGIPVQCKPKGNRQLFPFNLWYPTANYREKKKKKKNKLKLQI